MAKETALSRLAERLRNFPARPQTKIMEVCGTHTVAIRRAGVQHLLPATVKLVSGPGCPVCVTPDRFIDEAVALARMGVTVTSFGDMLRVPGSRSSLEKERAAGPTSAPSIRRSTPCRSPPSRAGKRYSWPLVSRPRLRPSPPRP